MFLQGYSWVNYLNIFYFSTTSIHYSLSANGNNLYSLMILSKYLIFHYDFNFYILLHSLSCSLKLETPLCPLYFVYSNSASSYVRYPLMHLNLIHGKEKKNIDEESLLLQNAAPSIQTEFNLTSILQK